MAEAVRTLGSVGQGQHQWTSRAARRIASLLSRLGEVYLAGAQRPVVTGIAVATVAFLLAAASTAAFGFPLPHVHDEYSYLLGAETFASGRLTNPAHPMWRYFETFHVLQQPSYNSKYPPASALFIAAGWRLTGQPIVGVWLSFAFMCAALYWMLRAWLGARWAPALAVAFGSSMALTYWAYSYWGGAVAAGAGALVLGALYRIVEKQGRVGTALTLGAGLLLLANSRPYEGAVMAVPVILMLLHWFWSDRTSTLKQRASGVMLPLLLVGAAGIACMAAYNKAVTGSWREMPYVSYQMTHDEIPVFLWQQRYKLRPATAVAGSKAVELDSTQLAFDPNDRTFRHFHAWSDSIFVKAKTPAGRLLYVESMLGIRPDTATPSTQASGFVLFFIPVALVLPFLLLPVAMRRRWTRFAVVTLVWTLAGMGLSTYYYAHYAAPLVGALLYVYGDCLLWLARVRFNRRAVGKVFVGAILMVWFAIGAEQITRLEAGVLWVSSPPGLDWAGQRRLIGDSLSRNGQRSLMIVRYGGEHTSYGEWVYNAANIDASPVVWARDKGQRGNVPLLDYFHDRAVWLVEVNSLEGPYKVSRYAAGSP